MPRFAKRISGYGLKTVSYRDPSTNELKTRQVNFDKDMASRYAKTFTAMRKKGLQIPAPFHHDPKLAPIREDSKPADWDTSKNGGWWDSVEAREDGFYGLVDVSNTVAKKIKDKEIKEVSLLALPKYTDGDGDEWEEAITHIAFVVHPIDTNQPGFVPVSDTALAFSSESLSFSEETVATPSLPENKGGTPATLPSVLKLLKQLATPVCLPDDTTPENLIERLVIALSAINAVAKGNQDDPLQKQPPGATTQQGTLAMNAELQFGFNLLKSAGVKNPATGQPWTEAEYEAASKPAPIQMSAEQNAALTFARKQVVDGYVSRIKSVVETGRVTPQIAKETAEPMLKSLPIAFSAEGVLMPTPLDPILKAWENIPPNSIGTGAPLTVQKRPVRLQGQPLQFSLEGGEVEAPVLNFGMPSNQPEAMADADVDAVLKAQGII